MPTVLAHRGSHPNVNPGTQSCSLSTALGGDFNENPNAEYLLFSAYWGGDFNENPSAENLLFSAHPCGDFNENRFDKTGAKRFCPFLFFGLVLELEF